MLDEAHQQAAEDRRPRQGRLKGLSKKPLCLRGQFRERVIVQAALAVGTIGGRAARLPAESAWAA